MNAAAVLAVARKDLRRRGRDPLGLLAMLAIPVALLVVFRLAFGGLDSGQMPRGRLLVVDADQSFVSKFVAGAFGQGRLAEMIEAIPADSATAMRKLRRDQASAALFLPNGFGRDFLEGRTTRLRLLKNPSERILPSIVEEIVATLADGGSAAQGLLSRPLDRIVSATGDLGRFPAEGDVASIAVDIQRVVERSAKFFLPPSIRVRSDSDGPAQGAGSTAGGSQGGQGGFLLLFFPGLVGMALLYLAQTLAVDLSFERKEGTLRRALAVGRSTNELFFGKTLAGLIVMLPLLLVVFVLGKALLGLPWAQLLGGWGLACAASWAVLGALSLLALLPRNPSQASVISNLVILPVAFLGGCYFPIEGLSAGLYAIAKRLPMGWLVERLKDVILGRAPSSAGPWAAAAVLVITGVILLLVSGRLASRRFREV